MESRILPAIPIMRSHEPPMWEVCGTLKLQLHPCSLRYLCTALSIPNSLHAPIKLVPQSVWSCFAGPRSQKKHQIAFMQLDASINSITLMWMAVELRQLNMMAHRLFSTCPPQVRLIKMDHGPNTSSPTYVKGGQVLRRSGGRSAIYCSSNLPRSFRQVMHFCHLESTVLQLWLLPLSGGEPGVSPAHGNVAQVEGRCDCL